MTLLSNESFSSWILGALHGLRHEVKSAYFNVASAFFILRWIQNGKCTEMNCTYCIICESCKEELDPETNIDPGIPGGIPVSNYIGMTSTSLHARHLAHRTGHQARRENNALVKHEKEVHDNEPQLYTAKMITKERGLLNLALREALLLEGQVQGTSLNDRKEKGRGVGMIRIQVSQQNKGPT